MSKQELPAIPVWAPEPDTTWAHVGSGELYQVKGVGYIEATLEVVVVYRKRGEANVWVRPLANFIERLKRI